MKVLITGGAGFLGMHLANFLHGKGCDIVLLDIDAYIKDDYPSDVKLITADVRDKERIEKITQEEKPDGIIHSAAALPLWKRQDIFSTNVDGTKNVLDAAKHSGIERVIFISSTAVYGVPKRHPIYEDDELEGVGPYGESKIFAEKLCEQYREHGLCVPILRPKTFIGPARLGVFEILFDWIRSGKRIPLIGSGNNRYQLLDVEDLCEAIYLSLIKEKEHVNRTFNIGAEEFKTVKEDLEELLRYAGSGSKLLPTPAPLVKIALRILEILRLSPLYKWVYGTADTDSFVSIERAKKYLGWQPKYSNAAALIRAYQWYLEHLEEIQKTGSGITHRRPWSQGALKLIKKIMPGSRNSIARLNFY